MQIYGVLLALVFAGCVAGGIILIMRQRHVEREKLARYTRNPGGEPQSIVCPRCSRRSYSKTAIRDRYCPSCKTFHDDRAEARDLVKAPR